MVQYLHKKSSHVVSIAGQLLSIARAKYTKHFENEI